MTKKIVGQSVSSQEKMLQCSRLQWTSTAYEPLAKRSPTARQPLANSSPTAHRVLEMSLHKFLRGRAFEENLKTPLSCPKRLRQDVGPRCHTNSPPKPWVSVISRLQTGCQIIVFAKRVKFS
jgi:hypothetical protein